MRSARNSPPICWPIDRRLQSISVPAGKTREHFDIPGFLQEQLFGAGVGLVSDLGLCTYADPARFFSHRYATHHGTTTGRQISIIGLVKPSSVSVTWRIARRTGAR